jgi:hypothetical protein
MPHFPTTQFMDAPDSRPHDAGRPKAAHRRQAPATGPRTPRSPEDAPHTALSSLSPSLLQDLMRFDLEGSAQRELLEVLAACLRHTQPLAIAVAMPRQMLTLTVFPLDRLVHCPVPLAEFLADDLGSLQVLQVQPARLRPPGNAAEQARVASSALYSPLGPLLWGVALQGARDALLPELAGQAAYRVSPGISLSGLDVPGAMAACITRLRRQTCNLREIASWPGIGTERAMRLLNALYLQSGLIVSRTHPAATNEGWSGY